MILAWRRLLWAAVLFCLACTVCSRTLSRSHAQRGVSKDAGSQDALKKLLEGLKAQQALSLHAKHPPTAKQDETPGLLTNATVTGFFFSPDQDLPGNRFDPTVGTFPDVCVPFGSEQGSSELACGNLGSHVGVPLLDNIGYEFVTVSGEPVPGVGLFSNVDLIDLRTSGQIDVAFVRGDNAANGTITYTGGQYVLESPAFRRFVGVSRTQFLDIAGALPPGLEVSLSGAEDLAAGRFSINIPAFTFEIPEGLQFAATVFQIFLEPKPRECEPGPEAPCCDSSGFLLNGNTCRTAAGECEEDATCNGVEPTCPVILKSNGTSCTIGTCQAGVCIEAPRECEPGPNALCCSPEGKLLKDNTCRTAAGPCEEDTTCSGTDPTCPVTLKADGTDCTNGACEAGVCVEAPRECEPGPNALCCSPEGKLLKDNTCRTAAGVCEEDTTCNGQDPTCPVTLKQDGTECAYDPAGAFPWFNLNFNLNTGQAKGASTEAQNVVTESGAVLKFLHHGSKCTGECSAGKCVPGEEVGEPPCWEQGANLLTCVHPTVNKLLGLLKKHC